MSTEPKVAISIPLVEEQPLAHPRATIEERARLLATVQPFDVAAWLRNAVEPTPEELADLEEFLQEREELRCSSLEHDLERLAEKMD
jgi:hypothetical protein